MTIYQRGIKFRFSENKNSDFIKQNFLNLIPLKSL